MSSATLVLLHRTSMGTITAALRYQSMNTSTRKHETSLPIAEQLTAMSGTVVSVRGSVVDIRFDTLLPAIHTVLRAGAEQQIVIEVLAQQDAHHVRGIALSPTQGLARGMAVTNTGGPLKAPVGKAVLSRMLDVSRPSDKT